MGQYFRIAAGSIFCLLALLHTIYTPSGLSPVDPNVTQQMKAAGLRISKGKMTMWDAWIGFNLSHALGAGMFGLICIFVPLSTPILVVVAAIYLVLAIRFWFSAPAIAIGIATACLVVSWLIS